ASATRTLNGFGHSCLSKVVCFRADLIRNQKRRFECPFPKIDKTSTAFAKLILDFSHSRSFSCQYPIWRLLLRIAAPDLWGTHSQAFREDLLSPTPAKFPKWLRQWRPETCQPANNNSNSTGDWRSRILSRHPISHRRFLMR